MKKLYFIFITIGFYNFFATSAKAQTLPVGTKILEDYYRRQQLLGNIDSSLSFSVRPLNAAALDKEDIFDPEVTLKDEGYFKASGPKHFANGHGKFQLLPISWQQQFNSHHPYDGNDGAMIPARGYQTMFSAGFFAKIGPLSIQLRPEFVYAQNRAFDGFNLDRADADLTSYFRFYNSLDAPETHADGTYSKFNWGQSSVRLTAGPMSLGLSTENLWWGPGISNSLLMSNNSEGFKHFTLNTVRPIRTPIGSFELQVIAGKLENSDRLPLPVTTNSLGRDLYVKYRDDWRYLSGFNINYQPKWIPGLFIGFIRDFVAYHEDVNSLGDYFPFFLPVEKVKAGIEGDPFSRDQRLSGYARWVMPKAKAEIYFEYALNDNSYNFRDFAGSPDHSRSYLLGISKLIPLKGKQDEYLQINAEVNQLSQTVDRLIRPAGGGIYQHYQVKQGYTHLGQVLGSGRGSGGDYQTISVNWVKGLKSLGLAFERTENNADFYNIYIGDLNGNSRRWVDFAFAAQGVWDYKNFIFNAKLQGIRSLNYQWYMNNYAANEYYIPHNDVFNFHAELGASFRF